MTRPLTTAAVVRARTRQVADAVSSPRRTLRTMLAIDLAILPLASLLSGVSWLVNAWVAAAIVVGPAAILRINQSPRVWQTWLGVLLLVPWLTARFASAHAVAGVIPTAATWDDISTLLDHVRKTTNDGVAPVHAGVAETFALALIVGLLAAFTDLVAVVGRRPALAGVPILVIFTISGAVPRHPVSWWLFLGSAAAFLLLLSLDASDTIHDWGRLIPRTDGSRQAAALGVSGPRIAIIAVAVAVVVPLVAPSSPTNLIANAFHNGNTSAGKSHGFGRSGGISLDPFAALKGELQRPKPVSLMTISFEPGDIPDAYYVRANVLSTYTDKGWVAATDRGDTSDVRNTAFLTSPVAEGPAHHTTFTAHITVTGLADNPPVFGNPIAVTGAGPGTTWSATDQLLLGDPVHKGQKITEEVEQPDPTADELTAAGDYQDSDRTALQQYLDVPADMPASVTQRVQTQIAGATTPFAKARALNDYFTDKRNGFVYSVNATGGDSGSDLVDFLTSKSGYCQQYAAALGIMLRIAGIPSRVVLGYTHGKPDQNGTLTITTNNAHAWVEAFFPGVGWTAFDPTPLAGAAGGATATLPYAPRAVVPTATGTNAPTATPTTRRPSTSPGAANPTAPRATNAVPQHTPWGALWAGLGLVVVLAVGGTPFAVRWRRRRGRLAAGRHGHPDPLWSELTDTARDLGYVWSPVRTPRQVAAWLQDHVDPGARGAVQTLSGAVERSRYAGADDAPDGDLVDQLRVIEAQLRSQRGRGARLRARLMPASVEWTRRWNGWTRYRRH